jgi:hypothetical protein
MYIIEFFSNVIIIYIVLIKVVGQDRLVGIATRYKLDVPRFSTPDQTGPGAHTASYIMGTGSFLGIKRPGRGIDHPPPPSSEVKERVELYISYTPSGSSWPVLRMDFTIY